MKPYPEYKDSGFEWIGQVPSHWDINKLGYYSQMIVPMRDKPKYLNGDIPWLRIEDFDGKYVSDSKSGQGVNQEIIDSMNLKVFPKDTVLCSCSCNMGKTAIVKKPLITNQTFIGIVPDKNLDSNFLYYLLYSGNSFLNSISSGAIQSYLSRENFEKFKIPVFPIEEQKQISKYLDHKTAQIDSLIEKKKRLIELLRKERTAVINQAVTKGLDPNVPMKDSGIEWLGEIPANWEFVRLKYLAQIKYGLGQPPRQIENGIPIIRATNVSKGKIIEKDLMFIDPTDVPYDRDPVLKTNDIIVVRSGAYTADSAIIPKKYDGAITGYDMVVRAIKVYPEYIAYSLLSNYVIDNQLTPLSLRAAQPHLNAEELGSANILAPPKIKEQISIVKYINKETTRIDTIISKSEKEIELLQEYRTALISEVVTGKIDVREERI